MGTFSPINNPRNDMTLINLSEYILLPRETRIAHIDLDSPCECLNHRKWQNNKILFRRVCGVLGIHNDVPNRKEAKIETCHLCPEKHCQNPYHSYLGSSQENRLDVPAEIRSEMSRKRWQGTTPEERSEMARQRQAVMTPEERSEISRKREEAKTPEQRSESARKREAARTPQQRSEAGLKGSVKRQKAILVINLRTGEELEFESIKQAARSLGVQHSHLSRVCNGQRNETGGYSARFI